MSTGNGGVPPTSYRGEAFTLDDGRTVVVPRLNLDEVEEYLEASAAAAKGEYPTESLLGRLALYKVALRPIYKAIARNHPDLAYEQFRANLDLESSTRLLMQVNEQNGFVPAPETTEDEQILDPPVGEPQ